MRTPQRFSFKYVFQANILLKQNLGTQGNSMVPRNKVIEYPVQKVEHSTMCLLPGWLSTNEQTSLLLPQS